MTVVTRMPPSPTGFVHVGNVRTLIFNYLYSKKQGGRVVFRSEDTDRVRSKLEYEEANLHDLKWLGLSWDEFHRQTERAHIYRQYLEKLVSEDLAYISREESKQNPGETVEVVRLRNANKDITFNDLIRGDITFNTTELGDFVIARSLDDALYHFTVVVDDHEMGITHVIRGEDHISNTPRQILIQEAIGASRPIYAHLPLILAPDRTKLSKRHGAVSLGEYRDQGFLPEAIVNYLCLLGWNPGTDEEILNMEDLINKFDPVDVHKGGAVFDMVKFRWVNKQHLDRLGAGEYLEKVKEFLPNETKALPDYSADRLERLLPSIRERSETLGDVREAAAKGEYDFAFGHPSVPTDLLKFKKDPDIAAALPRLEKVIELLSSADFSSPDTIKSAVWRYAEEEGRGEVLWPMRVALTGLERSPDPFTVAYIIGQADTLSRLKTACDTIRG
jgi:glutamyl-tRNA synthetase